MHDRGRVLRRRNAAPMGPWPVRMLVALSLSAVAGPALAGTTAAPEPDAAAEAAAPSPAPASVETPAVEPSEPDAPAAEPENAEATVAEPEPAEDEEVDAASDEEPEEATEGPDEEIRPPRIDGTYLGMTVFGGLGFARVNDFGTGGVFSSFGGTAGIGQMVFPWLGLGLHGGGGGGVRSEDGARQTVGQGFLGIQFKFVPVPKKIPLSLMASFGFGGGAVRQEGIEARSGFGGAQFGAAARYELFPFAKRFRPYRGGGFGLGPELGWLGFTPAAAGRPMSNVIYLALAATFYFGS